MDPRRITEVLTVKEDNKSVASSTPHRSAGAFKLPTMDFPQVALECDMS